MRCDDERDHIKFCFDVTFADCRREYLLPLLGATEARQNDGNGRYADRPVCAFTQGLESLAPRDRLIQLNLANCRWH